MSNIPAFLAGVDRLHRDAAILSRDAAARTVSLAFSSEVEVDRGDFIEVLSHEPGAVDLSRLNDGGAVLAHHDWNDQRGVVESAWLDEADRKGRAVVRFSRTQSGQDLFTDVADGIRRHVSVGYHVLDAVVAGERDDGTPIVLITRWAPYEISFVPVPADTTVGVGRSLAAPHSHQGNNTRMTTRSKPNPAAAEPGVIEDLRTLLRDAANAKPFKAHQPNGAHEPTAYVPTPVRRNLILPLESTSLVGLIDADGNVTRTPQATLAGATITLHGAIIAASRVAQCGANIIVRQDSSNAFATGDTVADVALERKPARLANINPATFASVDEDDDAATTALSSFIKSTDLVPAWAGSTTKAFSTTLSRSDFQGADRTEIMRELIQAITLGLARAADATLLAALYAATPGEFSLAALAARGLPFEAVRAIAGSSATGAAVGSDGVLRVAGIAAQTTADTAGTYIADWSRLGVAINSDVVVLAERIGANGKLRVSAFTEMLAVMPDPSVAWSVSA